MREVGGFKRRRDEPVTVLELVKLQCPNCCTEKRIFDGTEWSLRNDGEFVIHCPCGFLIMGNLVLSVKQYEMRKRSA